MSLKQSPLPRPRPDFSPVDWSSNEFRRAAEIAAQLVRRDGKRITASTIAQWCEKPRFGISLPATRDRFGLLIRPRLVRKFVEDRAAIGRPVL